MTSSTPETSTVSHTTKPEPTTQSPTTTSISDTCTVVDGSAKGDACVFPFIWSGNTYNECALDASLGDEYYWCSTKVDDSGNHVVGGGHWGKCDPETCPCKYTFFIFTSTHIDLFSAFDGKKQIITY